MIAHRSAYRVLALLLLIFAFADKASAQYSTWYLAEGATGMFEEDVLIGNPNGAAVNVRITFLKPDGSNVVQLLTVNPASRATVRVNAIPGLENTAVSAVVECTNGLNIVVERSMYFPNGRKLGGHNANGVTDGATKWILAEGATGFFQEFILISNPNPTTGASLRVTYLKEDGSTIVQSYVVGPRSRFTIWANAQPGLSNAAFSTVVESLNGVKVIAERAMYFRDFKGGHDSVGVTAPATAWRFAEGFSGSGFNNTLRFDTYLLLANPGTTAAQVRVTYFRESGTPITRFYNVGPTSRMNIFVDAIPGLESTAFSSLVESTNDVPIVAERSIYFGGSSGDWIEGHNSPGLTSDSLKWAFAEGIEDGAYNPTPGANVYFDSFYLVSNATSQPLALRATFVREDGSGIVRDFAVPAQSRFTVATGNYPDLSNQRFAVFLESTNGVSFSAERAVYWGNANGAAYIAGHGSAGVPWSGDVAKPTVPKAPALVSISPNAGNITGGTPFTLTGTSFSADATVRIGGVSAAQVVVVNSTTIVGVTGPRTTAGAVDVVATMNGQAPTLTGGFTYTTTAPLPPPPPPPVPTTTTDITLAFGDSITEGISSTGSSLGTISLPVSTKIVGYPERLRALLQARYPTQSIAVDNAGIGGEYALDGKDRLPRVLAARHKLLIILEGVNDTNTGQTISQIAASLRTMVRTGKNAGKQVVISTLLPVRPDPFPKADPARISALNSAIRTLASEEQVVLVDMFNAFGTNYSLLSDDGLHPNEAGYQRMAQEFFNTIVSRFQTQSTVTTP